MADGSYGRPGPVTQRRCGDDEERSSLPPTVYRTSNGYAIWRGLAVGKRDLPSLRQSVEDWASLEPYAPDIKRDNDHTRAVIRALEEDHANV